ncbi:MAG TPA: acetylglutamate kinase [Thermodesulfobacteriota bacterium]|nr:acetylglutamate kinase [Deltaproteobacteria bacterium]HNR13539.1 acetylglutamate kinase [Thermodesulfobacteriota bacterium]HNU72370.1 acetylglutamate kinase [Thermodesulfobacteriota bacterium]HOC37972.1 acetylglutamate kinase [Thermodesulfobacteriota bacterium]
MRDATEKASILMEALPYLRRFSQKTFVIKYGGSAMQEDRLKENFAKDIVLLNYIGIQPVVVHGGGPQIGSMLEQLGIGSSFVDGLRITDGATMDVVEMVLGGKINKEIVALVNRFGGKAVGLSGKDGLLVEAGKKKLTRHSLPDRPPELIDIGMVGEVLAVNTQILHALEQERFIPVIAPIGAGKEGESYNINADTVAGAIAAALKAEKLILMTDVEGVMDREKQLLSTLTAHEAERLIKAKTIAGGMIPKVNCCLQALRGGVAKTHIIDGRADHAMLLEVFTSEGVGTQIVLE